MTPPHCLIVDNRPAQRLWTPLDIQTVNVAAWYTVSDPTSFDLSGSDVLEWRDQTGTSAVVSPGYFAPPIYVPGGFSFNNNQPCFSTIPPAGSNRGFDSTGPLPGVNGPVTEIWALAAYGDGTATNFANRSTFLTANSNRHNVRPTMYSQDFAGATDWAVGTYNHNTETGSNAFDPPGPNFRMRDICAVRCTGNPASGVDTLVIAAPYNGPGGQNGTRWIGIFQEFLYLEGAPTLAERQQIAGYLFWQTHDGTDFGCYVPPGHPYENAPPMI